MKKRSDTSYHKKSEHSKDYKKSASRNAGSFGKKSFGKDSEGKPATERQSFTKRDSRPGATRSEEGFRPKRAAGSRPQRTGEESGGQNNSDRKPYDRNKKSTGDRQFTPRRRPAADGEQPTERPERSSAYRSKPDSDRKPYEKRSSERKPYDRSKADGPTKRYTPRPRPVADGEQPTERPERSGAYKGKSDSERKPYEKRSADRKPYEKKSFGDKREARAPYDKKKGDYNDGKKRPFEKPTQKKFADRVNDAFKPERKRRNTDERITREVLPEFSKSLPEVEKTKRTFTEGGAIKAIDDAMTLNKYISHSGECSRRDAAEMVKQGKVRVNGELILEPGYRVEPGDQVTLSGKKLTPQKNLVYILLNKPKGFITTTEDPEERKTVMDLVANAEVERLFPVGRLDRNTTGVLLLTNDGALAHRLAHPSYAMKKVYHVTLDKNLTRADYDKIAKGLELEDGLAQVDEIAYLDTRKEVGLEIHSGKNRIVRRIFESLGYSVEKLDRVMYAGLTKKNVARGKWRFLTEKEVIFLKHFKG